MCVEKCLKMTSSDLTESEKQCLKNCRAKSSALVKNAKEILEKNDLMKKIF